VLDQQVTGTHQARVDLASSGSSSSSIGSSSTPLGYSICRVVAPFFTCSSSSKNAAA
jgi:hypothetical protein